MSGSHEVSRRDFVKVVTAILGSIMGAVVGLPAIGYLISPASKNQKSEAWVPLGPLEKIPVGVPVLFSFTRSKINGWEKTVNSYGVYALRGNNDELKVMSNVCTHLSCRVTWNEEKQAYVCPCHDANFDIEGNVIAGPPPSPLKLYEAKVENGTLLILFTEG
jgi:Rieske Fe-S protein